MLYLDKVATVLAMPYALTAMGLLTLWLLTLRKSRWAPPLCFALLALHYACGAGLIVRNAHLRLEAPYLNARPLSAPQMDAVVVLGGGTGETPGGDAQLGDSGDRVALAARLYHAGLVQRIVCTGDDFRSFPQPSLSPAEEATQVLTGLGVPGDAIERVGGRNTLEEMAFLSKELDAQATHGLITSAWHMGRAMRLAEQAGLKFVPLPADFMTSPPADRSVLDWLPTADNAADLSRCLKEKLAAWVGR